MSLLLLGVVAAAVNLVVAELFDWFPWIARRLIRRAVYQLPLDAQERYEDEWLAELEALPGQRISPLIFAVRIHVGVSRVRQEIAGRTEIGGVNRSMALKYGFDRILATGLLVLLAPTFVCVALTVRLSSPGPVFSRQRRMGRDGKEFDLYKFRLVSLQTKQADFSSNSSALELLLGGKMAPNGVESYNRRTVIGRFLQRSALDELPQMLNVLRGEMSLIGPRPERPRFVEPVKRDSNRSDDCHRVKPGITGWAQVQSLRGQTSRAKRVEWDNYYSTHWSLGLDLKILVLTLMALFRSR